jgi:hypothetical protein
MRPPLGAFFAISTEFSKYTKQAQKDAQKLAAVGLKEKAKALLEVGRENPFQNPPPNGELVGDLSGADSRAASISSIGWFIRCCRRTRW